MTDSACGFVHFEQGKLFVLCLSNGSQQLINSAIQVNILLELRQKSSKI